MTVSPQVTVCLSPGVPPSVLPVAESRTELSLCLTQTANLVLQVKDRNKIILTDSGVVLAADVFGSLSQILALQIFAAAPITSDLRSEVLQQHSAPANVLSCQKTHLEAVSITLLYQKKTPSKLINMDNSPLERGCCKAAKLSSSIRKKSLTGTGLNETHRRQEATCVVYGTNVPKMTAPAPKIEISRKKMKCCRKLVAAQDCPGDVQGTESTQEEPEDTTEETQLPLIHSTGHSIPRGERPTLSDGEAANFTERARN